MSVIPVADEPEEVNVVLGAPIRFKKQENDDNFNLVYKGVRELRGLRKDFVRKRDRQVKNDAESKQINIEAITGYNYLQCIVPPYAMDYLAQLYDISPAHHAAVDAKVAAVFGLGYSWMPSRQYESNKKAARTDGGQKKLADQLDKMQMQMEDWVEEVCPEPLEEIFTKVGRDLESTGNAYIEIGRTDGGQIGYIGHVPSIYIRVRAWRDGFVQVFGKQVRYFRNFGEQNPNPLTDDPNPNELIHIKSYSPNSTYYGIPDVIAAKSPLAGNEFASRYNLDYFENKAIPRHVIVVKNTSLSAASQNRLVEFFETGLRGQHHRSILVPLGKGADADIEFKSIEAAQQDSSFGKYRESNNEEIFIANRIPPTRAGWFSVSVAVSAAKEADKVFKESYITPLQKVFEKKINAVFKEKTNVVILKLNELSLTDANTQSQIDERDARNQILLPDEIRNNRGLGPRGDGKGNEPFAPNAQQAADQKATAGQTRTRDATRSANQSDSTHDSQGRNTKGDGPRTA